VIASSSLVWAWLAAGTITAATAAHPRGPCRGRVRQQRGSTASGAATSTRSPPSGEGDDERCPDPECRDAQPGHHHRGLGPAGGESVPGRGQGQADARDVLGIDAGHHLAARLRSGDRRDGDEQEDQADMQCAAAVRVPQPCGCRSAKQPRKKPPTSSPVAASMRKPPASTAGRRSRPTVGCAREVRRHPGHRHGAPLPRHLCVGFPRRVSGSRQRGVNHPGRVVLRVIRIRGGASRPGWPSPRPGAGRQ